MRVGLDEQGVDAHGGRSAHQVGRVLPLGAGSRALAAGELQAVGGVVDHREPETAHHGKPAEIDDQVVVAEAAPSFSQQNPAVSALD